MPFLRDPAHTCNTDTPKSHPDSSSAHSDDTVLQTPAAVKMNQCTLLAIAFGIVAVLLSATSASTVPLIYCQPNTVSDVPPKVRQLCFALLERVEAPQDEAAAAAAVVGEGADTQLYGRGTKRQDVDHVFLRFGRRLGL